MPTIELACKTLTPLWTGGAERAIDRIHETGLLGSMRWWFEAFLRGVGAEACDPTTHHCLYDAETDSGICAACRVFGATGWRRRFRLTVIHEEGLKAPDPKVGDIRANRPPRNPTWYFDGPRGLARTPALAQYPPKSGEFTLRLDDNDGRAGPGHLDVAVIAGLLQFMADHAAIGARNQMGFGRFEITGGRQDTTPFYEYLVDHQGAGTAASLPALDNLFFATVRATTSDKKETFNLKYDLRQRFRGFAGDDDLRHKVMGTTAGSGIAAKVKMSWPDADGLIRVWGWLPTARSFYPAGWNRDRAADLIHSELAANWNLQVWREAAKTPRNQPAPATNGVDAFLRVLLHQEAHP